MKPTQKFKVIDQSILDLCIADYGSKESYETDLMNKASPENVLTKLKPILENLLEKSLTYTGGNYYKHSKPYLPHTDYKKNENNTLNIVIPLSYTKSLPSLVIFDQRWMIDSVTWCMDNPIQHFTYNTGIKGCPADYPVTDLTNEDINDTLYQNYLNHYPKNLLRGLTGKAFPFEIGSIIVFDNRFIHCTSNMDGEKLGITLRFT
jgi:hypothetical protein